MKKSIKSQVFTYLDELESPSLISGWQLFESISALTGRKTYPSTLLDYCREYSDLTGSNFICIDHEKSKYSFSRLNKLGSFIV